MAGIIYKEESYKIIGAIYEVYNTLGTGFLESVYQEALEYELDQRGIPFESQPRLKIPQVRTITRYGTGSVILFNCAESPIENVSIGDSA